MLLLSASLDWTLIREEGATYLGSLPVGADGERRSFYVSRDAVAEALAEPLASLNRACTPLPETEIIKGLGQLIAVCKIRALDEDEIYLTIRLFREKLRNYPADAVTWALKEWPQSNVFFPS